MKKLILLLIAISTTTIYATGNSIKPFNTFDDDSRVNANMASYPGKSVGRLTNPQGSYCTATLVSKDLILTAAHCLMKDKTFVKGDYLFQVGFNEGQAAASSGTKTAWWGTTDPEQYRQDDWAFMSLTIPLGTTYGWMGVTNIDLHQVIGQPNYELIAYNSDWKNGNIPSDEPYCTFSEEQNGFFLHNCDTTPGASGGAMFYNDKTRKPHIVAINVAEFAPPQDPLLKVPYSSKTANIAVSAQKFLPKLLSILESK